MPCLLYTSDAADDSLRLGGGGRAVSKKTNRPTWPAFTGDGDKDKTET